MKNLVKGEKKTKQKSKRKPSCLPSFSLLVKKREEAKEGFSTPLPPSIFVGINGVREKRSWGKEWGHVSLARDKQDQRRKQRDLIHFLLPPSSFSILIEPRNSFPLLIPISKLSYSPRKLTTEKETSSSSPYKQRKQEKIQEEEASTFLITRTPFSLRKTTSERM